jgi:formamidopyrimidine-DNA glycosylase
MPELPEVERVRLSLIDHLVGRRVVAVEIQRADVVELGTHKAAGDLETALLRGLTIRSLERHGKQLAIAAGEAEKSSDSREGCRVICVHLGMTGSLTHHSHPHPAAHSKHTHLAWRLDNGSRLLFDDPRRFGGVWPFPTFTDLRRQRWAVLGDDALLITGNRLHERLQSTRRGLKAALLDQSIVAGLGNIYVDELLFERRLHPMGRADGLKLNDVHALVAAMRLLLRRSIASGGSSLRDYVDGNGQPGAFQLSHRVYGRAGQSCLRCDRRLRSQTIAGRTTVWCPGCQKRP